MEKQRGSEEPVKEGRIKESKITILASDWTGCGGEEGPGIPGTLGTTVTGLTS